jgi:hypothetical protein
MTRGTTRQILADLASQRVQLSPVHITRTPESGLVQITVAPQPEARAAALKMLFAYVAVFGVLGLIFGATKFILGAILCGWLLVCCLVFCFTSYDRASRAYVFRADREKIVVASSGPLGARYWECRRADLIDVRIAARRSPLGKKLGEEFNPQWIEFDPGPSWNLGRTFGLDLGRDDFILLGDAVREGLGMPKTTWM